MACLIGVIAILVVVIVSYLRGGHFPKLYGLYTQRRPCFDLFLKTVLFSIALWIVKLRRRLWRRQNKNEEINQNCFNTTKNLTCSLRFVASDKHGNVLLARVCRRDGRQAEISFKLRLASDGSLLSLPINTTIPLDETSTDITHGVISAGGLRIRTVEPVKTYRLIYSGLMRRQKQDSGISEFVECNLRFWFRALTDPAHYKIDFSPSYLASKIAIEDNSIDTLRNFIADNEIDFEQTGEIRGFVEIHDADQGPSTFELSTNGLRQYHAGLRDKPSRNYMNMMARFENGLVFSLRAHCFENYIPDCVDGFVAYTTGYVYPLTWTDFSLARYHYSDNLPQNMVITFCAHDRVFELKATILVTTKQTQSDIHENVVKFQMGKDVGYGVIEFSNTTKGFSEEIANDNPIPTQNPQSSSIPLAPRCPTPAPLCVQLSNPLCRNEHLSGGKAAKLADIVAFLKQNEKTDCHLYVPEGFSITSHAYEMHVSGNKRLADHVKAVLAISSRSCSDKEEQHKLEKACNELKVAFQEEPLTQALERQIEFHLRTALGDQWENVYTAVRSSAIGEDGWESSGAGQMETFLGIQSKEKIIQAVKSCWASHFSFRAVQYRRQLCATLDGSMSVLIQRLFIPDVAGVLFTRHPDTGSTAQMIINASYGLGEAVVSGSVQPDTITVHKSCEPTTNVEKIKISYDVIGEKATTFRLAEADGQLHEESSNNPLSKECCLTEDEVKLLHSVGRMADCEIFMSGRDIEFGLKREQGKVTIAILQARPITTTDLETEWELQQEFDTPLPNDRECIATTNIQEMMPGPLAPLPLRMWMEFVGGGTERCQTDIFLRPKRRFDVHRAIPSVLQHVFLNFTYLGSGIWNEYRKRINEYAVFGRRIDQLTIESQVEQTDMNRLWCFIFAFLEWVGAILPNNGLQVAIQQVESYKIPAETNPKKQLLLIKDAVSFVKDVWREHLLITADATNASAFITRTLTPSLEWSSQIKSDIAMLLSSCDDVFSADIPTLLQEIAASIQIESETERLFLAMDRKEATNWLLSPDSAHHGELLKSFLNKHGHRCVRDTDIREKSWNEQPEKLVDALKLMIANKVRSKNATRAAFSCAEDAINSLETRVDAIQRLKLKWMLPKARKYVGVRECSKSYFIKAIDLCRQAWSHLAQLLAEAGHIPDPDLLYFLDVHEIETLLEKRSPYLIAKALRRRKFLSKFENIKFEEICFDRPRQLSEPLIENIGVGYSMHGTAVGSGCIQGIARVVKTLSEANKIQAGDILVVPFTDIGWSPYFPMIAGLVTELGGLISHGAVVAREYGLPCIVGCKNATHIVKTGDVILLDGRSSCVKICQSKRP